MFKPSDARMVEVRTFTQQEMGAARRWLEAGPTGCDVTEVLDGSGKPVELLLTTGGGRRWLPGVRTGRRWIRRPRPA